ncbi:MAG: serine/threonine protein kinase [Planctomycetales bacterium]|nr:serine/threonine protein kinase [Planctomycetales bacterium]
MTPEEFQQAQQLFLAAIELPQDQRGDFLKRNAASETVRDEASSLLSYHDTETMLPSPLNKDVSSGLDETVEFESGRPSPVGVPSQEPASLVGLLDIDASNSISERFAKSTNLLLRSRLIVATFVLSGMLIAVTVVAAIFGELVLIRLAVRGVTLLSLAVCCWFLFNFFNIRQQWLRLIEVVIIAIPLLDLSLIQWFESSKMLADGEGAKIEELRAIIFSAVSVYIAVYGMFIPSNWRRTAVVTGLIALLPSIISVTHQSLYQYPQEVQWMHFANPTLTATMAVVATIGAGIVHRVRREAESAKYYGQYRLIKEIGRGGMGIVYLGKHQMLKRPAAIKLIHANSAGSPQAIAQFEKEVQATATLSHWNTVQIYDYGTTDEGDFYCVMEYLRGETLQQRLKGRNAPDSQASLRIIVQLCDGLEEAHHKGLVHRDIKPANIFLAEVGGFPDVVKLLDFGLVVTKEETQGEDRALVGGTPSYMSPEQIRGEPLDGRSDIYAIGCVLFECLTGSPPFQSYLVSQLLSDHLFHMPRFDRLPDDEPGARTIVQRCLAKDRDGRFENVSELRSACRRIIAGNQ